MTNVTKQLEVAQEALYGPLGIANKEMREMIAKVSSLVLFLDLDLDL